MLAITDMQGRLQGKRLHARYFLDEVLEHGTEGCNYLLAVDVDMNTVDGYAMSSWERGYGDFVMRPDLSTLRRVPWQPGTALLLADLAWEDGSRVVASPRQILRRQLDRLAERGLAAYVGTELEFVVFQDTYEEAWRRGYRDLTPANLYNVDYSLLGTARVEPLLRRIRIEMAGAGLYVESAKGECNLGQHEIAFRYADALVHLRQPRPSTRTAPRRSPPRRAWSLTFMAKPNEREGNSCHIHLSLRDGDGEPVMAGDRAARAVRGSGEHFLAGQLACMRELTLLYAPEHQLLQAVRAGHLRADRGRAGAWTTAPARCGWSATGRRLRVENRVPGGDVNPYLAVAALIAAGLHGIEHELALEEAFTGNAYAVRAPHGADARCARRWRCGESSSSRQAAFGDEVVAHYANNARVELAAFDAAVTDWELFRGLRADCDAVTA